MNGNGIKGFFIVGLFLILASSAWAVTPVRIQEFGGYQDPFSGKFFLDTLPQITKTYGDNVVLTFKHFPLSFHPDSQKSAEAAECARDQEKFDEYHSLLFHNSTHLDVDSLKEYAKELKLDTERFNHCLETGLNAEIVNDQYDDGLRKGVIATPTFFVGGETIIGAQSFDTFKKAIDKAMGEDTPARIPKPATPTDQLREPIIGRPGAVVKIMTFFDYSSPYVKSFYADTMPLILEEYPDTVQFIFTNFPLSFYSDDQLAAVAGECAHEQEMFEEYSNVVFANNTVLNESALNDYAHRAGLDTKTFNDCMDDQYYLPEVLNDEKEAKLLEVSGVPVFFIEGPAGRTKVFGSQPFAEFQKAIELVLGRDIGGKGDVPNENGFTTPQPTQAVRIEDEIKKTTPISCNEGCFINGSCISVGIRIQAEGGISSYCGLNSKLESQRVDGAACQNNFECVSNTCNTGVCVNIQQEIKETQNAVQQLFDWLGDIFGRR
jgi:protein-disulfide isomerase